MPGRIPPKAPTTANRMTGPAGGMSAGKPGTTSRSLNYIQGTQGFTGNALGRASGALSWVSNFTGLSLLQNPLMAGVLTGGGMLLGWLGNREAVKGNMAGTALRTGSDILGLPRAIASTTGGDIVDDTTLRYTEAGVIEVASAGARVQNFATKNLGDSAGSAVGAAREGISFLGNKVSSFLGGIYSAVKEPIGVEGRLEAKVEKHKAGYQKVADGVLNAHNTTSLVDRVRGLLDSSKGPKEFSELSPSSPIRRAVEEMGRAADLLGSDVGAATEAMEDAYASFAEADDVTGAQKRAFNKYAQEISKEMELRRKQKFWENPVEGVKENLKQESLGSLVGKAGRYLYMAHTVHGHASRFSSYLRGMKLMVADLEGTDPEKISTSRILFGKLPEGLKQARSQMWTGIIPSAALTLASVFGERHIARGINRVTGGRGGALVDQMAHGMLLKFIDDTGRGLEDKPTLVASYASIRAMQEVGQEIDGRAYMAVLQTGSAWAKNSANASEVRKIAMQYAKHQTPIEQVLKDMDSGIDALKQRAASVDQDVAAYEAESNGKKTAPATEGSREVLGSWTNKFQDSKPVSPLSVAYKREGGYLDQHQKADGHAKRVEMYPSSDNVGVGAA